MNQSERRAYLIKELLHEKRRYFYKSIPVGEQEQRNMIRSLSNVRKPAPLSKKIY